MDKDQIIAEAELLCDAIDEMVDKFIVSRNMKLSQEVRKIHELQSEIANQKLKIILKKGDELREHKNR